MFSKLFLVFVSIVGIIYSQNVENLAPISPHLVFVANVDGKSYFVEHTFMNWTTAGNFCRSLNMKLATIISQNQFDALDSSTVPEFRTGHYWTSARDSFSPRQFSWNETEEAIPTTLPFKPLTLPYYWCLAFYKSSINSSYLTHEPCSITNMYTLCET